MVQIIQRVRGGLLVCVNIDYSRHVKTEYNSFDVSLRGTKVMQVASKRAGILMRHKQTVMARIAKTDFGQPDNYSPTAPRPP